LEEGRMELFIEALRRRIAPIKKKQFYQQNGKEYAKAAILLKMRGERGPPSSLY
jgi:hypothetical protein